MAPKKKAPELEVPENEDLELEQESEKLEQMAGPLVSSLSPRKPLSLTVMTAAVYFVSLIYFSSLLILTVKSEKTMFIIS